MCVGPAAGQPVISCWIWVSSRPATISRDATTRARTPYIRCKCGCVHRAAWPSCWPIPPCRRNRGEPSPPRSCRRRPTPCNELAAAGWLPEGGVVAEYGSPHGGSWLGLLAAQGRYQPAHGGQADVIIDCFGMMHAADQRAALAERAARIAPGGVLLLQYHALSTIIDRGQWNALRHGHFAYYSTTALTAMLAAAGFRAFTAWRFELYGGNVLLAAIRDGEGSAGPDGTVGSLLAEDAAVGVWDPRSFARLHGRCSAFASDVRLAGGRRSAGMGSRVWRRRLGRSPCCVTRTWIRPYCRR